MNENWIKLKNARLEQGISIEHISEKTKIRPHLIEAIEAGNEDILPEVYIKSFIKTYAAFLKIPLSELFETQKEQIQILENIITSKNEVTDNSNNITALPQVTAIPKPYSKKQPEMKKNILKEQQINYSKLTKNFKKKNFLMYFLYSGFGIAIIFLFYFFVFDQDVSIPPVNNEQNNNTVDTTVIGNQDKSIFSFFNKPDSLILEARATDTAWIRIDIDGKVIKQFSILPNMELRWSAKDYFQISLGNAGAVIFSKNGEELEPFGKIGTVVRNIKITKTEILSPSNNVQDTNFIKNKRKKKEPEEQFIPPILEPSIAPVKPYHTEKDKKPNNSNF